MFQRGNPWDAATSLAANFDICWDAYALQVGFNVELGGYFSIKRNAVSMDGDTFLTQAQVVPYCQALLEVYRCETQFHTQGSIVRNRKSSQQMMPYCQAPLEVYRCEQF